MDKLEKLATSIDEKTVNQTVFVKARPGLGFSEDVSSLSPQEKLNMELTEKADKLSKALRESKAQNDYLAEKVKVLETEPATSQTWYANENSHNMYVNQAKGKSASKINFQKQKSQTPFRPGKGKYGNC